MKKKIKAKYYRDWYKSLSSEKKEKRLKQKRDYYHRTKDKPEEVERRKKYYQENKEKHSVNGKLWRKKNKKYASEHQKAYRKANPHIQANLAAKRNAQKKNAMLPSTDLDLIKEIYKEKSRMNEQGKTEYQVDHIIPISIGGAHHQDNLRIVTAKENRKKHGKYIPELGGVWADNDLAKETKRKLGIK